MDKKSWVDSVWESGYRKVRKERKDRKRFSGYRSSRLSLTSREVSVLLICLEGSQNIAVFH